MRKIILPLTFIFLLTVFGCAKEDSPEDALQDIKTAIAQCDYEKFSARVDVKKLIDSAYEDSSSELAMRAQEFGSAYPDDPFFRNSSKDILLYNELHHETHMKFIRDVVAACFDRKLIAPNNFADDTIAGTASELRNYYLTAQSTVDNIATNEFRAELKLNVHFQSLYVKREYELPLVLVFEKDEERWRLKKIKNVGEIISPLLDIAETLWIN